MANPLIAPLMRYFSNLSYPRLLVLVAVLFVVDSLTLDPLPFLDEILLGVGTLFLAKMRKRKDPNVIENDDAR